MNAESYTETARTMAKFSIWAVLALVLGLADPAQCQPPAPGNASPQIRKEWALGAHVSRDLEDRDGRIDDAEILGYLARIESKLSTASGKTHVDVRLTRSSNRYVAYFPNRKMY